MELQKDVVKVNEVMHEDVQQNIIEGDIIISDSKPDVVSIINVDGKIKINSQEIRKDMITLRGTVCFNIIYISDDPSRYISSMEHTINFDRTLDIQGIDSNMLGYVNPKMEYIDCIIINGRKLSVKGISNCNVKIIKPVEVSAISNIEGIGNIQTISQSFDIYNFSENCDNECSLDYEMDIPIGKPAIKEILKTNAMIKNKDVKFTGGKAVVKGDIEISCLYIPDMGERAVEFVSEEFPFSEVIDIDEQDDFDDIKVLTNIKEIDADVKEDDDGDSRVVCYDVTLDFNIIKLQKKNIEVVSDAYGIDSNLELQRSTVKVNDMVGDAKTQATIKDTAYIPYDMPTIKEMCNVTYNPIISDLKIENDNVNIEGVIESVITYLSNDENNPLICYKKDTPFSQTIEVKGARPEMNAEAIAEIENCSMNVSDEREIDFKFTIIMPVKVLNEKSYDIVTNVEETPIDNKNIMAQPSMMVYYVQNGDTLWGISKRYLTTLDKLLEINEISNPDMLMVGQQLMIPKVG